MTAPTPQAQVTEAWRYHIGCLRVYLSRLSTENWRDIQASCDKQIDALESALSAPPARQVEDEYLEIAARELCLISPQADSAIEKNAKGISRYETRKEYADANSRYWVDQAKIVLGVIRAAQALARVRGEK